jgi:hypothetical protein
MFNAAPGKVYLPKYKQIEAFKSIFPTSVLQKSYPLNVSLLNKRKGY